MTPKPRLTGEPIMRILCKKTDNQAQSARSCDFGQVKEQTLNAGFYQDRS